MADETKTLAWRCIVETQGIEKNTREAADSLAKMEGMAGKAGNTLKGLGKLAAVGAIAALAKQALDVADAYTEMTNKIRGSTDSAEELSAVQFELIEVAEDTRTTVEGSVNAYNRLHDATEGLGLSQREVIDLTETLIQTNQLSGESAEQAAANVGRFAVALEQGTLSARDFKQLLKESPELLKALAHGLGVSRQEMQTLAAQGKLTSQVLIDALGRAAPEVAEKFNKMAPTIKSALTSARSSFGALIGEFNQGLGVTDAIARGIQSVAGSTKEFAMIAREFGINLREGFQTAWIYLKEIFKLFTLQADARDFAANVSAAMDAMEERIRAARDALKNPVDLNVKSETTGNALTAEQVQVYKDLDIALDGVHRTAIVATDATAALFFEITQGKETAEAFKAQMDAVRTGQELEARFRESFAKQGLIFGDREKAAIQEVVVIVTKLGQRSAGLKNAWNVVNSALESSMTPFERATKNADELHDAILRLQADEFFRPEQIERAKEFEQQMRDSADVVKVAWADAGRAMVDGFVDFLVEGSFNVKQFAQNMIREIGRIMVQMLILKSIENTPFGKSLRIGSADGNAFSQGRVIPMASGGIVSSPTFFPMANGGTGLMGEAGPEAVLPLARLASGKLGVSAEPQNIQVINNTGVQANARIERTANRTSIVLEAAQLGAQLAEDRITRSMRSGYGATSTALQRTYALRRRG